MLWLKAFHLIFVVCWFAGLFYLPRIFVYYAASEQQRDTRPTGDHVTPAVPLCHPFYAICHRLGLGHDRPESRLLPQASWMWLKLAGVAFLVVYHLQCGRYVTRHQRRHRSHGHVFYRFFNEVPVLFLFGIVLLAVLKPF